MRKLFWGGIHPEGHKDLSRGGAPVPAPLPVQVVLPMVQHIGAACTPLVQVGDQVKMGQKIGDSDGLCAPVHASVSGKVVAVEPRPHPNGREVLSVVIENDYTDTPDDALKSHLTHQELSPQEILGIIREAGIVGMGGATFPTDVKAFSALGQVDYILINACECEPYITADDTLLCTYPEQVIRGTEALMHTLTPRHTIIAVEDNKAEAIRILKNALPKDTAIEVRVLPTRYPQGAEKQLIQAVTGRQVPPGKLPAAVGCAVFNAATAASVYQAVYEGKPVTRRIVTVTGDGAAAPKNMIVRNRHLAGTGHRSRGRHPGGNAESHLRRPHDGCGPKGSGRARTEGHQRHFVPERSPAAALRPHLHPLQPLCGRMPHASAAPVPVPL